MVSCLNPFLNIVFVAYDMNLTYSPSGKHVHEKYTPLNPLFFIIFIVKLGFKMYLCLLFLLKNIETPRQGGGGGVVFKSSNMYIFKTTLRKHIGFS